MWFSSVLLLKSHVSSGKQASSPLFSQRYSREVNKLFTDHTCQWLTQQKGLYSSSIREGQVFYNGCHIPHWSPGEEQAKKVELSGLYKEFFRPYKLNQSCRIQIEQLLHTLGILLC